jgi:hypothetical protein
MVYYSIAVARLSILIDCSPRDVITREIERLIAKSVPRVRHDDTSRRLGVGLFVAATARGAEAALLLRPGSTRIGRGANTSVPNRSRVSLDLPARGLRRPE